MSFFKKESMSKHMYVVNSIFCFSSWTYMTNISDSLSEKEIITFVKCNNNSMDEDKFYVKLTVNIIQVQLHCTKIQIYLPSFWNRNTSSIQIFSNHKRSWYYLSKKVRENIILSNLFNVIGNMMFSTLEN